MRPPKRIRFGAYTYRVRTGSRAAKTLTANGHCGETHVGRQEILLKTSYHSTQVCDTLLHECLHVINDMTGTVRIADLEEDVILRWTPVLLGVLRDNPELVAYLLDPASDRQHDHDDEERG